MTNSETRKQPTHYIYAVRKGSNAKGFWTRIGAAWINEAGSTFNIKLAMLPLDDSDIVMWPAAGLVDTEKRCFMKLEVRYGEASIQS
jgi:hypothetical protein